MSASARIQVLKRDERTDFEDWGEPICVYDGHWNPFVAIRHYLEDGDDHPAGTYRCKSSVGTATVSWDGDRIA